MDARDFCRRTRNYALQVIRLAETLPSSGAAWIVRTQLAKAGTSVAANYRGACRAGSHRDFVCKLGIVEEECDESLFWLELLPDIDLVPTNRLKSTARRRQPRSFR
jgi:four helix bundle protein